MQDALAKPLGEQGVRILRFSEVWSTRFVQIWREFVLQGGEYNFPSNDRVLTAWKGR